VRVAVVAGPDPGHAFPAAGLTVAFLERGHEATLVTGRRWQAACAARGLPFRELPVIAPPTGDDDAGERLSVRAAAMTPPLVGVLRALGAHLVIADTLTRAGGWAAGLAGLPWVELVPHLLPDPSGALPPFGTGWAPWGPRDRVLRRMAARSRVRGEREQAAAFAGLAGPGQPPPPPRHRLLATLPALEPVRPDWPVGTSVVGPLEWDPSEEDLPEPAGRGPLVLCSGSTAAGGVGDLGDLALAALSGTGVRVAVTRLAAGPVAAHPPWAACGPGRQQPLLAAASVVLTGGGHGMVAKALVRGLPVVCVPGGGDQKEVAGRVVRLGAGVATSPRGLRAAVLAVLGDPAFARAARAAAARGTGADPVEAALA
jgi:UDP:flavonoid glycosyltransferase YjiC (YdhE family)